MEGKCFTGCIEGELMRSSQRWRCQGEHSSCNMHLLVSCVLDYDSSRKLERLAMLSLVLHDFYVRLQPAASKILQ